MWEQNWQNLDVISLEDQLERSSVHTHSVLPSLKFHQAAASLASVHLRFFPGNWIRSPEVAEAMTSLPTALSSKWVSELQDGWEALRCDQALFPLWNACSGYLRYTSCSHSHLRGIPEQNLLPEGSMAGESLSKGSTKDTPSLEI